MTFLEFVDNSNASYSVCDDALNRYAAFAEASYNEYMTNVKEAELKVINENGTEDDLIYLEKGASEGFIVRAKNVIDKMIEAVVKFVTDIVNNIKDFFSDKTVDKTIKSVEKASKTNPKIKNAKVKIPDVDKGISFFKKEEDKCDRKLAMVSAGKFSSSDKKDIEEVSSSFSKGKAAAAGSLVLVSVGVAIGALLRARNEVKKTGDDTKTLAEQAKKINDNISGENNDITPENIATSKDVIDISCALKKEKSKALFDYTQKIFKAIRSVFTGSGEVDTDINLKEESVENNDEVTVKEESVENTDVRNMEDLDKLLNDIIQEADESLELNDDTSEVTESSVDDEINASMMLESIENELREKYEEIHKVTLESIEAEVFGTDEDEVKESVTPEEYLESMEDEILKNIEEEKHEATLESIEQELFGDDEEETTESPEFDEEGNDDEVTESVTPEEYLESMESELFNEDEETEEVEESGLSIDDYLDKLEEELS